MNKQELTDKIRRLMALSVVKDNRRVYEQLASLQNSIVKDFYRVIVLGEFKRGKSTFVNSLLGDSLLPMAVLPETATVNMIMHNDEPCLQVVYKNGKVEQGEASEQYLKRFSALVDNSCANDVEYIMIGYPVDMLENRIILIDTPGVADLDETRCDVTYGIVPTANAVIFLLDASTPLTKSEKDFIDERLIPQGIDNILFIVNKYDLIDEEEEEEFLEDLDRRLRKAFKINTSEAKLKDYKLLPLSASMALKGLQNNDKTLIEFSGINEVKSELLSMLDSGKVEQNKLRWYEQKFKAMSSTLLHDIESAIQLKMADKAELQESARRLDELIAEKEEKQKSIESYCLKSQETFCVMADKSVMLFGNRLQEDIADAVNDYQGADFKDFVENKVARKLQKSVEAWLGSYSPHINQLIANLEREVSIGMSHYFNQQINLKSNKGEIKKNKHLFNVEVMDISNVGTQAGLIAGAGSVGIFAILGAGIMPMISLAAVPFFQKYMLQKKLTEAKEQALPEIKSCIAKTVLQLQHEICSFIQQQCKQVQGNAVYAYGMVLNEFKNQIKTQLEEKKNKSNDIQQEIENLKMGMKSVREVVA